MLFGNGNWRLQREQRDVIEDGHLGWEMKFGGVVRENG